MTTPVIDFPERCPKCRHYVESYYHSDGCGICNRIKIKEPHWHHYCNNSACCHEWTTKA